jgi:predicted DNA binding CopG/RHH family protein
MKISAYLVRDTGGKDMKSMNRKIMYVNAPKNVSKNIMEGEIISDFLPPPEQLIRREPKVKITITLNSTSVDFFKKYAEKNKVKYQTMINEVLDLYAKKYNNRVKV